MPLRQQTMPNLYGDLCTQFYDLDKPSAPADALALYLERLSAASGPALEPMCGSGRFLVPLLEAGIDADGTDASPQMLAACRAKCERLGLTPTLYLQTLQELSLPRQYASIFIPSGSFGFVVELGEVRECLRRMHDHLLAGGLLIIEVQTPAAYARPSASVARWVVREDGARIVANMPVTELDAGTNIERFTIRYELFEHDQLTRTETEDYVLRCYEIDEFAELLRAEGFVEVRATKPYIDVPATPDDPLVVFTAHGQPNSKQTNIKPSHQD